MRDADQRVSLPRKGGLQLMVQPLLAWRAQQPLVGPEASREALTHGCCAVDVQGDPKPRELAKLPGTRRWQAQGPAGAFAERGEQRFSHARACLPGRGTPAPPLWRRRSRLAWWHARS